MRPLTAQERQVIERARKGERQRQERDAKLARAQAQRASESVALNRSLWGTIVPVGVGLAVLGCRSCSDQYRRAY